MSVGSVNPYSRQGRLTARDAGDAVQPATNGGPAADRGTRGLQWVAQQATR